MDLARRIVAVLTGVFLFIALLGAGYATVTYIPQVSGIMTGIHGTADASPFDKTQLVELSQSTREYTAGTHDRNALMTVVKQKNTEIDSAYKDMSLDQLQTAPEQYTITTSQLSHLDECNTIFNIAKILVIVMTVLMLAGTFFVGITGSSYQVGLVYMVASVAAILAIVAVAVWAISSWDSFFQAFHGLLFKNGNWTFGSDSLLICMYPAKFWTGMGIIWGIATILCSIIFFLVGRWMHR